MESIMEVPPADPQRVAARAVGRTPEEHAALEQALAKRRAQRAAQRQQRQRINKRTKRRPKSPEPEESSNENRVVTIAKPEPALEELKLDVSRWLDDIPGELEQPMTADEYERQALFHLIIRNSDPGPPSRPLAPCLAYMPVSDEAWADRYEASETDAVLVKARRQIRAEPGLSDLCKIVLLLTTQIPFRSWTTYKAIQDHLIMIRRGCPIYEIGQFLAQNPVGDAVPCHRVIASAGGFGKPMDLGWHYDNREEMLELLLEEGMEIKSDGSAMIFGFLREFVGCPRV
ncbi:hypothetical protein F4776DRAFT_627692 [Hypoxylon sp. NC0597]|nr:hypothetical protein F4776DRAFT_627692 [Hypoxylon sp. NC0597]